MNGFPQSMTLSGNSLPFYERPGSKVTREQAQDVESGSLCWSHGSVAHGYEIISKPPFSLWVLGGAKLNDACETLCELESPTHSPP